MLNRMKVVIKNFIHIQMMDMMGAIQFFHTICR